MKEAYQNLKILQQSSTDKHSFYIGPVCGPIGDLALHFNKRMEGAFPERADEMVADERILLSIAQTIFT